MKVDQLNREVNLLEIAGRGAKKPVQPESGRTGSFKDMFSGEVARTSEVHFSRHARERLFSRGIDVSNTRLDHLSQAIDRAAAKGSRDTLILDDKAAYVVSVTNRTVITAFDRDNLKEGVFTSIDSAVII